MPPVFFVNLANVGKKYGSSSPYKTVGRIDVVSSSPTVKKEIELFFKYSLSLSISLLSVSVWLMNFLNKTGCFQSQPWNFSGSNDVSIANKRANNKKKKRNEIKWANRTAPDSAHIPVPFAKFVPFAPNTIFSARYLVTEYPGISISLSDVTCFVLLSVRFTTTANGANPKYDVNVTDASLV